MPAMPERFAQRAALRVGRLTAALAAVAATVAVVGCETKSWIDPSELVEANKKHTISQPLVVPIIENFDFGLTDANTFFSQARPVRPEDLEAQNEDYRIGPNDQLQISVADLLAPGTVPEVRRVTATGTVSLPLLDRPVDVEGLTEAQASQAIRDAYQDADLLNNAVVSLTVVEARNRTFYIRGAIPQPGQYPILQSNFRLRDALVLAGDINTLSGVEYAYIIRSTTEEDLGGGQDAPSGNGLDGDNGGGFDELAPQSRREAGDVWEALVLAQATQNDPTALPGDSAGRTMDIDGRQVEVDRQLNAGEGEPLVAPGTGDAEDPTTLPMAAEPMELPEEAPAFQFEAPQEPEDEEVIRVPVDRLLRGEHKYNVAIMAGDYIVVEPPVSVGFYYMGGHFARTGAYQFNGQKLTLTQATIAAGMLDPVAIPQRTMLVRRVSTGNGDYQVHARLDLAKIFAGTDPDIYLMPDDQIRVGTNALAPFIAAARNAFRITYGFGFLYDRNYARDDNQF